MSTAVKTSITVEAKINAPVERVWSLWTDPKHIVHWNNASDDWYTPKSENDLRVGGRFTSRMESRDGENGFDFGGEYTQVSLLRQINYTMDDDRKVQVTFDQTGNETIVRETFDAENTFTPEQQKDGWQAILNNFKKYVEKSANIEVMHFEITINALPEKVAERMIGEKYYSEWTSEFNPKSRFEGSWEKGAKILFIGEDPDGSTGGMISKIREHIPNKFVSIEHLGMIRNGQEILCGPEIEAWAGARENYTFSEQNGQTLLSIDVDTNRDYMQYFSDTWPKALQKLKAICEEQYHKP